MRRTADVTVVSGLMVALIGVLLVLAGPATAEAKAQPRAIGGEVALIASGAGYGTPHGSAQVRTVQRLLFRAGDRPGPVDGRFGPLTEAAVQRFQGRHGLAVDGIVGPVTATALRQAAALIAPGAGYGTPHGSTRVRTVQRLLFRAGDRPGPVDGRFGPLTEAAVQRFQGRHGLAVDGIVGKRTRRALERFARFSSVAHGHHEPAGKPVTKHVPRGEPVPRPSNRPGLTPVDNAKPRSNPGETDAQFPLWLAGLAVGWVLLLAGALALERRRAGAQEDDPRTFQVRIVGRRGRDVETAAELLLVSALAEGRNAEALSAFRKQRSDAVMSICRIGEARTTGRRSIGRPHGLIVEDPAVLDQVELLEWLEPAGYLLVDSGRSFNELGLDRLARALPDERRLTIPVSDLAPRQIGRALPNAVLLGGFAALTGVVTLDSVGRAIQERFPEWLGPGALEAAEAGFRYVQSEVHGRGREERSGTGIARPA